MNLQKENMEFLVGSHNKIRYLSKKAIKAGEWKNDTFWCIAKKYDMESIIQQIAENELVGNPDIKELPQVAIYGELCGAGVQKHYSYNIPKDDLEIRVFDIMINRKFLDWDRVKHLCDCFGLPLVNEIYRGPWSLDVIKHAEAVDEYGGKKFVREGIVIKPVKERWDHKCGRVCFKYLDPAYLLDKRNTEYH